MDLPSGDISSMIFKRLVRNDLGNITLDRQTLVVLTELDGKTTLGALASKAGLTMARMRALISNLLQRGLIEKIEKKIVPADEDFFRYLTDQFALAVGPIAGVLIEDEVQSFGQDLTGFPSYLTTDLVDRLARDIRREEKKTIFIKNMVKKIQEKEYTSI